ncbi:LPS export ABC transporter periplasmic protein LptC [bacterium]|nr:LPS export ABC transporter periplasmic protein LptC [bacterium]
MKNLKKFLERFNKLDKKKKSYLIAIFVVIFIMMWAFISAGIITTNFNRAQIKGKENEQKVDAVGIIITETKKGKKYFEIYGENGNYSNDHSIATLNNVIGNFYKDGNVSMSFQSSKGTYNEKTGVITLYENTYIVLDNGISLNANRLIWSGSNEETVAEGNVKIKKNNEMMSTANRCVIGANYDKFRIEGNTTTKVWKRNK